MNDCIFCKIVRNEIPNVTVYEDDVVKAFLDITQVTPGHTQLFLNVCQKLPAPSRPVTRQLKV